MNNIQKTFILLFSILLISCANADFDDFSKRNKDWAFWIDSITGKGSWVRIGNEMSVQDGRYIIFYSNGMIFEKGKLRNGKRVDTVYCYDLNENIIKYQILQSDTVINYYLKDGNYIEHFQNCTIFEKGIVENHKRGNEWTRYFENGKFEYTESLINKTGWAIRYYDNGNVQDSTYRLLGELHGTVKQWFKGGQIAGIGNWDSGKKSGLHELYFENGQVKQRGNWLNGKRDSISETWYENGQKELSHHYKNGELNGDVIEWYSNGQIKLSRKYKLGKEDGKYVEYYENGKPRGKGMAKDGIQIGEWFWFDEKGKQIQKDIFETEF